MRILIFNTRVPFVRGGAETLEKGLMIALKNYGHESDIIRIMENHGASYYYLLKMIMQVRLMEIEDYPINIDRVIALKFPSYYVKHHNKVVWFLHHYRQFYDLWNTEFGPPINDETLAIREIIIKSDTEALKKSKKVFAISKTVAERLKKYNNIDAEVLYPPVEDGKNFYCESYEDYIFFPSRLSPIKRHELAIKAMRFVKAPVRLIIAGGVEDESYLERLKSLILKYNLQNKVEILQNLSKRQILELYSRALAVVFPSFQEDYGYITIEAMYSKKAVVTCNDSGGPIEFVENNVNGFIVEPKEKAIAEAICQLYVNKNKAIKMGERGYEKILSLDINWGKVVDKLCYE
uniref:Glycosyltransferase n=1 Tax=candidate division WOR-3 bacterium TaxID=2052148 RepID=A0A7C2NY05_UNCW3